MSFESFVAFRYLTTKKNQRFLFVLSLISFIGIFLSVLAFFVIYSVMDGFSRHMREALVGFQAPLTIEKADPALSASIKKIPSVTHLEKVSEFFGLIETEKQHGLGVKVRGVDSHHDFYQDHFDFFRFDGQANFSLVKSAQGLPGILLGEELYTRLMLYTTDDNIVYVVDPFGDVSPSGEIVPQRRAFEVVGVLSTGFYDFDAQYALVDRQSLNDFSASLVPQTKLLVHLDDVEKAPRVKEEVMKLDSKALVFSWQDQNKRLFAALNLEKWGMFLLLVIVSFIASFNILALMHLLAQSRLRDASLFFSLGLSKARLKKIFMWFAFGLGGVATVCGVGVGFLIVWYLKARPLDLPPAYYLDHLPVLVEPKMVLLLLVVAPLLTLLASLIPYYQIAKIRPIEILRAT